MPRPLGSVAAVLTAALIVGGGTSAMAAGCALSPPSEYESAAVDPTLPGIDAASNPVPQDPGRPDAASGGDGPDVGKTFAPDAAADAAPQVPGLPKPTPGEVLITEVMFTTTGPEPASEWIELHSVASSARSLAGLMLRDGSGRTHVLVGPLTIAPGAWIVLARSKAGAMAAKVPSGAIAYEYGAGLGDSAGVLLTNGATGGVSLLSGATVITAAPYGGWYAQVGSSVQLAVMDAAQSSTKASWCLSTTPWSAGSEKGTPGAPCDCPGAAP